MGLVQKVVVASIVFGNFAFLGQASRIRRKHSNKPQTQSITPESLGQQASSAKVNIPMTELYDFCYGSSGLDMSKKDAEATATYQLSQKLTALNITKEKLLQLKKIMYTSTPGGLDMSKSDVQRLIFSFVDYGSPSNLPVLFKVLYGSPPQNMDLSKGDAQSRAIELWKKQVDAGQLQQLWNTLYTYVDFSKRDAQVKAIELAYAGADPRAFWHESYKNKASMFSKNSTWTGVVQEILVASFEGQAQRYADDGKNYSASVFQQYYGNGWVQKWTQAPQEERVAADGVAYTIAEFAQYYKNDWKTKWARSSVATQRRMAADGRIYSMQEFVYYYKQDWQTYWRKAAILQ